MRQLKNSRLLNAGGYEITEEEAEAVLAERDDIELDEKQLRQVACGFYLPDTNCSNYVNIREKCCYNRRNENLLPIF